ncbi:MAG: polysaccharide deacetylase family protein [Thermodesulfobacteriota bacterium]|nr:polysaccharide deacetylase family protein [Thermodesulfobacteriota bacterium]
MKFLDESGYKSIKLEDVNDYLTDDSGVKDKAVVITFDDGFRDFYTEAFLILQEFGFSATMFLPTAFIHNNRVTFKEKECLSWEEVRELSNKGIIFGSHTVNHPRLNMLKKNDIRFELKESKKRIEQEIGEPIKSFSYPYAFPETDNAFTKCFRSILESGGYQNGVTTRIGTTDESDDIFFLKRIILNSFDDFPFFLAKLEGGYDWLHEFQYIVKSIKRLQRRRN